MTDRAYSDLDRFFGHLEEALRTVFGPPPPARPSPAAAVPEGEISEAERVLAGRLMRVDHAGEICAQALYQGQAVTARRAELRSSLEQAAAEENDHLAWTEERLRELGTHTSYLNPLWYLGSFTIGALAGLAGDKWSLGFLAETERQVVRHLEGHLERLPPNDHQSRAILAQMREDEGKHATVAIEAGAAELPEAVKLLMRATSKIMTETAYWI